MLERIKKALDVVTMVAMLGASASVVYVLVWRGATPAQRSAPPVEKVNIAEHLDIMDQGATKGTENAKVVMIEFTDFQCPYCGRFARDIFPDLEHDFIDTHKIRYVLHNLPLPGHPFARNAAVAAECAGLQERYWDMHDRLFANQEKLAGQDLIDHAAAIGLDVPRFKDCTGGDFVARLKSEEGLARRLGVNSTPTFFIGEVQGNSQIVLRGKVRGAQPYAVFKAALDDTLSTQVADARW